VSSLFLPAAVIALASQALILGSVLAGRAPASSRRPMARWLEIAWAAIPTVALVLVLWATWGAIGHTVVVQPALGVPA
jgi:heme/copper-type cytochrome/quinol oxidase subunit 2